MFYTRLRFSSSKLSVYCPMKPLTVNEIKDFIPLKRVFVISLDLESCTLAGFRQWLMLQLRWYKCTLATSLLQLTKNLSPCFKIRAVQCEYGLSKEFGLCEGSFCCKTKEPLNFKSILPTQTGQNVIFIVFSKAFDIVLAVGSLEAAHSSVTVLMLPKGAFNIVCSTSSAWSSVWVHE